MAAVLAQGPEAVLSHRTAADHWGIRPSASARVEVTIPSYAGRKSRDAIVVHRSRTLGCVEVTVHDRIPTTRVARTLLDIAALVGPASLERAIELAETLRLFDLREVVAALDAHPGKAGNRALKAALGHEPTITRSELEARFLDLCASHGIPRPSVNVRVGPYEVDFLWPEQRLIVETDGHRYHGSRMAIERDHVRDVRLMAAGYRVTRFTYRQVMREPAQVARALLSLLA